MDIDLENPPDSGQNPIVYFDIAANSQSLGRIHIKLFRDVFPAGVENFVLIAAGVTYRIQTKGCGKGKFMKETQRSYTGCKFFHKVFEKYVVSGDIYTNTGQTAGTIYDDKPIPADVGPEYIPHESRGLVSLVPFEDETTGELMYDSTFMITLDCARPSNGLSMLDEGQIVIGYICEGIEVLDRINEVLVPFAGRNYPELSISLSGVSKSERPHRQPRDAILALCEQTLPVHGALCPLRLPGRRRTTAPSHPRCQTRRRCQTGC
ncbi:Cyclophilin type peptidyl-prolyl cis-trans isomerase/CLD [uncultured virus]|nr:Cyclophilin type peptidyl-prolyl cis-trans isomerase/CLD [uncultured virus]